jgi:hypothetical protein
MIYFEKQTDPSSQRRCEVFSSNGATFIDEVRKKIATIVLKTTGEDGKIELTVDIDKLETHW